MSSVRVDVLVSASTAPVLRVAAGLQSSDVTEGLVRPSLAYGEQRYFWCPEWQRAERLADYDLLVGDDYLPTNVDDLVAWLESDE